MREGSVGTRDGRRQGHTLRGTSTAILPPRRTVGCGLGGRAKRVTDGAPFSGPCTSEGAGLARLCDPVVGESGPGCAHPCPNFPRRYHRHSSVWEGWEARGVLRHHRRAGREELPLPAPAFRGSRSPEPYDRSRHERCNSEEAQCASRYHPGIVSLFHAAGECGLRLSWRLLLQKVPTPARLISRHTENQRNVTKTG